MPPKPRDIRERFWEKVAVVDDADCWLWRASLDAYGYGQFGYGRPDGSWTMVKAHRTAYELLVGPIPEGYQIDHLCRVRSCCNPAHMEPVTQRTNLLRGDTIPGRNARKTHCSHGHEFTGENVYLASGGGRVCRACVRRRSSEKAARAKEQRRASR